MVLNHIKSPIILIKGAVIGKCRAVDTVIHNLHNLTKKNCAYLWHKEEAFQQLKSLLCTVPKLACLAKREKFVMDKDASALGIGGVLSQIMNG